MKKNIRVLVSIVFVFCFIVVLSTNSGAVDLNNKIIPITQEIKEIWEKRGVEVNDNAILEVVEVNDSKSGRNMGYAWRLTQVKNGVWTSDVLAIAELRENEGGTRSVVFHQGSDDYYGGTYDTRNKYVVHGTASWNYYESYYIRPLQVSWDYEKLDSSINVSNIIVSQYSGGVKYSYPSLSNLGEDIEYIIDKPMPNPTPNVTYSKYNPLQFSLAIDVMAGFYAGHLLVFDTTVNGHNCSYSIGLGV